MSAASPAQVRSSPSRLGCAVRHPLRPAGAVRASAGQNRDTRLERGDDTERPSSRAGKTSVRPEGKPMGGRSYPVASGPWLCSTASVIVEPSRPQMVPRIPAGAGTDFAVAGRGWRGAVPDGEVSCQMSRHLGSARRPGVWACGAMRAVAGTQGALRRPACSGRRRQPSIACSCVGADQHNGRYMTIFGEGGHRLVAVRSFDRLGFGQVECCEHARIGRRAAREEDPLASTAKAPPGSMVAGCAGGRPGKGLMAGVRSDL